MIAVARSESVAQALNERTDLRAVPERLYHCRAEGEEMRMRSREP
jgi:hypothetical protein